MSISGTILFGDTNNDEPLGGRRIVSVFGFIAIPHDKVGLYVKPDHQQIVRGDPAMLSLFLTGQSIPIPEQHLGQSYDYLCCQKIWRTP